MDLIAYLSIIFILSLSIHAFIQITGMAQLTIALHLFVSIDLCFVCIILLLTLFLAIRQFIEILLAKRTTARHDTLMPFASSAGCLRLHPIPIHL